MPVCGYLCVCVRARVCVCVCVSHAQAIANSAQRARLEKLTGPDGQILDGEQALRKYAFYKCSK